MEYEFIQLVARAKMLESIMVHYASKINGCTEKLFTDGDKAEKIIALCEKQEWEKEYRKKRDQHIAVLNKLSRYPDWKNKLRTLQCHISTKPYPTEAEPTAAAIEFQFVK